MKSYLELVQETLVPPTKVYYDKDGNYAGSQVDIYPAIRLFTRCYALFYCVKWVSWPLWAPFGYWIARWWCNKYDASRMKEDPKGWPDRKQKIILKYKLCMYLWISFMTYGYLTDWGM